MPFLDEDLKKLKIYLESPGSYSLDALKLDALLARLEAAEQLCDHDTDQCEQENMGCRRCKLTKAWRKVAGK